MKKLRKFIFVRPAQPLGTSAVESVHNRHVGGGKTSPFKNIAGLAEKLQAGGRGYEHHEKLDAGAAVIAGGLGMGTASAQSFEFGVYSHGPAAYIPPCPGPGYVWVAGYETNGY